jgi:hypothetical protein
VVAAYLVELDEALGPVPKKTSPERALAKERRATPGAGVKTRV